MSYYKVSSPWTGLLVLLVFSTSVVTSTASKAEAQGAACDPSLQPTEGDELGYRSRGTGNRCEGRYVRKVHATSLAVAGLTEGPRPTSLPEALRLRWSPPNPEGQVHLRARSVEPDVDYRMDARQPGEAGSFTWPMDVLIQMGLGPSGFGVVAWTEMPVDGQRRRVYLPVRFGAGEGGAYRLDLLPGRSLQEVFLTLVQLEPETQVLRRGEPLGYGYYPAQRATPIVVDDLPRPGLYRLELGAQLEGGGVDTNTIIFYHSGS